jgi:hypothetical protein
MGPEPRTRYSSAACNSLLMVCKSNIVSTRSLVQANQLLYDRLASTHANAMRARIWTGLHLGSFDAGSFDAHYGALFATVTATSFPDARVPICSLYDCSRSISQWTRLSLCCIHTECMPSGTGKVQKIYRNGSGNVF